MKYPEGMFLKMAMSIVTTNWQCPLLPQIVLFFLWFFFFRFRASLNLSEFHTRMRFYGLYQIEKQKIVHCLPTRVNHTCYKHIYVHTGRVFRRLHFAIFALLCDLEI